MIILLLLLSALHPRLYMPATDLATLSTDSIEVNTGTAFTLPVFISGVENRNVTSYQYTLRYDPAHLTIDSVSTRGTLSAFSLVQYNRDEPGLLRVAGAHVAPLPAAGPLLELHFRSLDLPGPVTLDFEAIMINEGQVDAASIPGVVHIISPQPPVHLSLDTLSVYPDASFALPIRVTQLNTPIYSGRISLVYNAELMTVTGISTQDGALRPPEALVDYTEPEAGVLDLIFASSIPVTSPASSLLHVQFESTSQEGTSSIHFNKVLLNEADIPISYDDGLIIVRPAFAWGDTNEDAVITWEDAALLLRHLLYLSTLEDAGLLAADVSGNNAITSFDAALILQYIVGAIPCFPADNTCFLKKQQDAKEAHAIYSLEIAGEVKDELMDEHAIQALLPKDWIMASHYESGRLDVRIAGSSPLSPEDLASIKSMFGNVTIRANDAPLSTDTRRTVAPLISVFDVFPSPFEYTTSLHLEVSRSTELKVTLFDIAGRPVGSIFRGRIPPGMHVFDIEGQAIASGLYIIQVITDQGKSAHATIIKL